METKLTRMCVVIRETFFHFGKSTTSGKFKNNSLQRLAGT